MKHLEISFSHKDRDYRVPGLLDSARQKNAFYVFAHGAGAGMGHHFMEETARGLNARGISTLRFEFPYMAAGRRRPDHAHLLQSTIVAAVREGQRLAGGIPLFVGGKSMGGRMSSLAASRGTLPGISGCIFLGFPLHPAGKPAKERAEHLMGLSMPLLFVQGTRDRLAEMKLLRTVFRALEPGTHLHMVDGADHGFETLKRSGRTREDVHLEILDTVESWMNGIAGK